MVMKKEKAEQIKRSIFGSAWDKLVAAVDDIGGFVVFHDTREIAADENTVSILGEGNCADYERFTLLLDNMNKFSVGGTSLRFIYADTSQFENVTAGIVAVEQTDYNSQLSEFFEFSTKTELIQMLNAETDGSRSALTLVQIAEGGKGGSFSVYGVFSALTALKAMLPPQTLICSHYKHQFWVYVPDTDISPQQLGEQMAECVKKCEITDEFGVMLSQAHRLKATIGISLHGSSDDGSSARRMHDASFALYEAASKRSGVCVFSFESYEQQKNDYHSVLRFMRLIEQNLFMYHFQPIVSAQDGEIVAYEALMRTDSSIGLGPLEILDIAQKQDRLYDIEVATLNNTLSVLSENQAMFQNRKLFVNAIPSQILNEEDYDAIAAKYGELLEKVVIELTEQTEISDEKLEYIHARLKKSKMQLAIDDYGTGYSNTSNLLRYNPDIVKIDRSLIADIDKNEKTRGIVSGIIDFLHASGYIALGEGVETVGELQTLINMSIDLLQGYYISRPKPVLLDSISKSVCDEIKRFTLEASGQIQKIYRTSDGETIDLSKLALEKYTDVFIDSGKVTLTGDKEIPAHISLTVKDEADVEIVMRNVNISVEAARESMRLGSSSRAVIVLDGDNTIGKLGIFVPRTADLRLTGSGNLSIISEEEDCYAIGCGSELSCGNIKIDMSGRLDITANGDKCIAIGGGRNDENNSITILGGALNITCTGGSCVGIGCISGKANVRISDCGINAKILAATSVGIGSAYGDIDIDISNFSIDYSSSGNKLCSIGSLEGAGGGVKISKGQYNCKMNGKDIICIGTNGGTAEFELFHSMMKLYAEGSAVCGIGDRSGSGDISVVKSEMQITLCTGNGFALGSGSGKLNIEGGKKIIKVNE